MVEHGNHPDLHRLAPVGAGGSIPIGGRDERGVRDLVGDLALMPVEAGNRVAIIEAAHRMTEDAQSAFLKTLEEPPARTTIILCADDEERILPTIRSRCARVRLGPMGPRDVEVVLAEQGVADAPTAARLARITNGRPGHAIAYARAPEAVVLRSEVARTLLDLLSAGITARLTGIRELGTRSVELVRALDAGAARAAATAGIDGAGPSSRGRGRGSRTATRGAPTTLGAAAQPADPTAGVPGDTADEDAETSPGDRPARLPASERRRGALALLEIWRAVARDVGLVVAGDRGTVRDPDLLDDIVPAAAMLDTAAVGSALRRLDVAAERLEGNVSPELVLDVLALHWAPSSGA